MLSALVGVFLLLLGCSGQNVDYYSKFKQAGCLPLGPDLTPVCRQVILDNATIDKESFKDHPEELEQLIRGIYFIYYAPMDFPLEKKMFGLGTMKEAELYDFISEFGGVEHPNQKMLNYILNASPKMDYGCVGTNVYASYTPLGIHYCSIPVLPTILHNLLVQSGAFTGSVLLHEARHHEVGYHTTDCGQGSFNCDKGMDHCYGWNVTFWWGLLQGIRLYPQEVGKGYPQDYIKSIADLAMINIGNLYSLSERMTLLETKEYRDMYRSKITTIEELNPWANRSKIDFLPFKEVSLPPWVSAIAPIDSGSSAPGILYADSQALYRLQFNKAEQVEHVLIRSLSGCAPVSSMVVADWSGDGIADLMTVGPVICGFKGDTDGGFALQQMKSITWSGQSNIQAVDLNGDLAKDFVVMPIGDKTRPVVLVGLSGSAEHMWNSYDVPIPNLNWVTNYTPLLSDIDGNGTLDLVLHLKELQEWLIFYKIDATGTLLSPQIYEMGFVEKQNSRIDLLVGRTSPIKNQNRAGLMIAGFSYNVDNWSSYNFFETSLDRLKLKQKLLPFINWVWSEDTLEYDKSLLSFPQTVQFDGNQDGYIDFMSGITTTMQNQTWLRLYVSSPLVHWYHLERILLSNQPHRADNTYAITGDFNGDKKIDIAVLLSSPNDGTSSISIVRSR